MSTLIGNTFIAQSYQKLLPIHMHYCDQTILETTQKVVKTIAISA